MTYSIELQMVSKDAAGKILLKVSKTSEKRVFNLKTKQNVWQEYFITSEKRATGRSSPYKKSNRER